jgi:predicted nucleotidyltransferase
METSKKTAHIDQDGLAEKNAALKVTRSSDLTDTTEQAETDIEMAQKKKVAEDFYREALQLLVESGLSFLVGGGFALKQYTGIQRDTKDLDIFCKAGEYPKIMKLFTQNGFETELTDVRWLAKLKKGDNFVDVIFNTVNNICNVDDSWFDNAVETEMLGMKVKMIAAEELYWCKIYVQNRERYDGADLNHLLLKYGKQINWDRVWMRMEQHWHLLLAQFLNFQFVYPSERDIIPKELFEKLMALAKDQYELPSPVEKVCLGPIIDQTQYSTDIRNWDYKVVTIKTV